MSGRWAWNPSQRGVLIALLGVMLVYLTIRLVIHPEHVPDPQPPQGWRALELEDRIDPNRADWPTLAALPLIGEKRARDIVAYRDQFIADNPGRIAFIQPADLMNVSGIGPATIAQIEPFLIFPDRSRLPASRPD